MFFGRIYLFLDYFFKILLMDPFINLSFNQDQSFGDPIEFQEISMQVDAANYNYNPTSQTQDIPKKDSSGQQVKDEEYINKFKQYSSDIIFHRNLANVTHYKNILQELITQINLKVKAIKIIDPTNSNNKNIGSQNNDNRNHNSQDSDIQREVNQDNNSQRDVNQDDDSQNVDNQDDDSQNDDNQDNNSQRDVNQDDDSQNDDSQDDDS